MVPLGFFHTQEKGYAVTSQEGPGWCRWDRYKLPPWKKTRTLRMEEGDLNPSEGWSLAIIETCWLCAHLIKGRCFPQEKQKPTPGGLFPQQHTQVSAAGKKPRPEVPSSAHQPRGTLLGHTHWTITRIHHKITCQSSWGKWAFIFREQWEL